jgi:hypothetical protein
VRIQRLAFGVAATAAAVTLSAHPAAAACLQSGGVVNHSVGPCSWDNYVWAGPFSNSHLIFVTGGACSGAFQRAVGAVSGTLVNGLAVWHVKGCLQPSSSRARFGVRNGRTTKWCRALDK